MKTEKKLSIKVKSKTERRIMEDPEVEMISEWNIKRILIALVVVILLVVIPAYYLSGQNDNDLVDKAIPILAVSKPTIKKQVPVQETDVTSQKQTIVPTERITSMSMRGSTTRYIDLEKHLKPEAIQQKSATKENIPVKPIAQTSQSRLPDPLDKEQRQEHIIVAKNVQQAAPSLKLTDSEKLNAHITRAQLAQGVNKLEPYGQVSLPLLVDSNKAQGITYFTEVKNMQGNTVFHEWLKEGKSIYKRKIIIRGNRWRFYTSKLFTYKSAGQWQVRIITGKGNILHKIDFSVQNR